MMVKKSDFWHELWIFVPKIEERLRFGAVISGEIVNLQHKIVQKIKHYEHRIENKYQAWAKGPVAHEVYDAKNGAFSSYIRCEKKGASGGLQAG